MTPTATQLSIMIPQVIKSPAGCNRVLEYSIVNTATGQPVPFVTLQNGNIVILTNDPSKAGQYSLTLSVKP